MRYIDRILTLKPDNADNALILGHAIHTGIEKGVEEGVNEYLMAYPVITDEHINESIKLEYLIPKVQQLLPPGAFEVEISDENDFTGFMDLLVPVDPIETFEDAVSGGKCICQYEAFDLYDFKYSNNSDKYAESRQLHLYKNRFEKLNPGKKIRNMYFVMIPKVNIKQKKTESLEEFRFRIESELSKTEITFLLVKYDPEKVIEHWLLTKQVLETTDFPKEPSWLCRYCEYEDYCMKGYDYMLLPQNERRTIETTEKKVVWVYGMPFSGKTFFANAFPDPLMLNSDGNIKFVDAPYIAIKDEIIVKGRMQPERKFAWEMFKEVITELEKKENTFKSIVVDLLEDMYEHCRIYVCNKMGISHESDDSFRAWDKVRGEFLNTLKRLMALDYENIILISHQDVSKDITKKGGDKITAIKPNINDKVANKIAGMVDIVARAIAEENNYTLSFKTSEVIFGGGRLTVSKNEIPSDYEQFCELYDEANKNAVKTLNGEKVDIPATGRKSRGKKAEAAEAPAPEESKDIAERDMYFYHAESDSYWMIQKGEELPTDPDAQLSVEITKAEYEKGIAKEKSEQTEASSDGETETTDAPAEAEQPKVRTRRKRGE